MMRFMNTLGAADSGFGTKPTSGGKNCRGADRDALAYGFSLLRGKRPSMEDTHSVVQRDGVACFGIFDGHGGAAASEYLRENLFNTLLEEAGPSTSTGGGSLRSGSGAGGAAGAAEVERCIVGTFRKVDSAYLKASGVMRDDGSTATTAIVVDNRVLYVANTGDSRTVLGKRNGAAVQMSVDHKPGDPGERRRVEAAGGIVLFAGTWRVGGVLAVSRAFGDRSFKQFVIPDPDVRRHEIDAAADECVILATDGLWDVVSNEDAVKIAHGIEDAERAATKLCEVAYERGSFDNVSVIVVRFPPPP